MGGLKCISASSVTEQAISELKKEHSTLIGTHSGTFHQDEVVGCYLLKQLPAYQDAAVVRCRDDGLLSMCDIVIDVGGSYDPSKLRFDHHQKTFQETWSSTRTLTKLSSAGLVWKHFGKQILQEGFGAGPEHLETLHQDLYDFVFEAIDCNDNGVRTCKGEIAFGGGLPSLSASIAHQNTSWIVESRQDETTCFHEAYKIVCEELGRLLRLFIEFWPLAKIHIVEALDQKFKTHDSGRVVELTTYYRWERFVPRLDRETEKSKRVAFVIWKEQNEWHLKCLRTTQNSTRLFYKLDRNQSSDSELIVVAKSCAIASTRERLIHLIEETLAHAANPDEHMSDGAHE
eukprot:Gregarina_sp_Poly_1__877@NODE_120_length_13597_cov_92_383592_g107_i0_p5_GENE_NODE_120_length_13597_cov_92_383592_g107_i0NODE_120_length_13597_cov_92_383592_g107_i0_p5_ORF_typecomplete_len344_score50_78UPF0160/PF03690_13/7_6e71LPD15/PF18828_1/0_26_NODE_120_length_13597_cov_92_383592_g107_i065887619